METKSDLPFHQQPYNGERLPKKEPDERCNARTRYGTGYCRHKAGWGTDHVGQGRCKKHHGRPVIHGGRKRRYDGFLRSTGHQALVNAFLDDDDPLNVYPEIAALRAHFVSWERLFTKRRDTLDEKEQLNQLRRGASILEQITRAVNAEKKYQLDNAITRDKLRVLFNGFWHDVQQEVDDPDTLARIENRVRRRAGLSPKTLP